MVYSVIEIEARICDKQLAGRQMKAAVAEILPSATLFHPAIYPTLRNWLIQNNTALTLLSSHRIVVALASTVYSDSKDTNTAMEIAREMIARRRAQP